MWNEPPEQELRKLPGLYATENVVPGDKTIYIHFFLGSSNWYPAEYGPNERIFFGYAILNNDLDNAEWGYVSFDELREERTREGFEVDRDIHWRPQKASEIERIGEAYRHQGLQLK